METDLHQIKDNFKGIFLATLPELQEKLAKIKAYVFDWDGVFNNGFKDENGSSPFSEVDAMGTNLLRFNHYLRTGNPPISIILSGEKNKASFTLADREHFHAVYFNVKNKKEALLHLCTTRNLSPNEVAFFFDDVLDLSFAEQCGLRVMVGRKANPLLIEFAKRNNLVDYITSVDGGNHAVRESIELLLGLSERYDDTICQRMFFTDGYQQYLKMRNHPSPLFYTESGPKIIEQNPR
ncbi:MAG TPA: hypothetical protein VN721_02850 [Flavipsychrobacter sp.]|nr:hypothetical protein [Flavipsychrobacter sp.]